MYNWIVLSNFGIRRILYYEIIVPYNSCFAQLFYWTIFAFLSCCIVQFLYSLIPKDNNFSIANLHCVILEFHHFSLQFLYSKINLSHNLWTGPLLYSSCYCTIVSWHKFGTIVHCSLLLFYSVYVVYHSFLFFSAIVVFYSLLLLCVPHCFIILYFIVV